MSETNGSKSSEHGAMKDVQKWIRIGAGFLVSIVTTLLSAGVIPEGSAWIGILTMVVTVCGAITGEVVAAKNYTVSRTSVKLAELAAEKLADSVGDGEKKENPTSL